MTERTRDVWSVGLLVAVAAACWVLTVNRMQGMDMGPGTDLGGLGWFVGVWTAMMAAMMLPSLAPLVARTRVAAVPFAAGYILTWLVAGVGAWVLFEGVRSMDLDILGWDRGGRYVAVGVILAAALYEMTRAKAICLRRCREPELLAEGLRPGLLGAVRAGIGHGGYCVGCCWALMAALFALGVMSIPWMAAIAAVIAAEKLLPWDTAARGGTLVALAGFAVSVAA